MKALLYQLDALSRRLAAGFLEQHHHASVPVFEREEALAAIRGGLVDLVLADTQKDGAELILTIRVHERAGRRRTPIIALTIGDTPGNRQRFTEVGADVVLPIPIRKDELAAAVSQLASEGSAPACDGAMESAGCQPALDVAAALDRVEGDRSLLEELLRLFVDESQSTLRQIRDSWSAHDARAVGRLAHTLKGSSANVGATAVSEVAQTIERLARAGNLENAVRSIADLEREVERLAPELDTFLKETAR